MDRRAFLAAASGIGCFGVTGCLRLSGGGDGNDAGQSTLTSATRTPGTTARGSDPTATPARTETSRDDTVTSRDADDDTETSPDTTTESDGEDVEFPFGISEEDVLAVLVDTHLGEVGDARYEKQWRNTNVTTGDTLAAQDVRIGDGQAIVDLQNGGDVTVFYDSEGAYWRENTSASATYGRARGTFDLNALERTNVLRPLFVAGAWESPTVVDGRIEIGAEGIDRPAALEDEFEMAALESFSASGVVRESGVIERLQAEFQFVPQRREDRLFTVQVVHRITDFGDVSVSEPDWLGTAKERAPTVSVAITDDQQFVEFEHESGTSILPETNVTLFDKDRNRNWGGGEIRETVAPGTTMYFWMEDGRLSWSRGSRPTGADPQTIDGRYGFWMARGTGAEYFGEAQLSG